MDVPLPYHDGGSVQITQCFHSNLMNFVFKWWTLYLKRWMLHTAPPEKGQQYLRRRRDIWPPFCTVFICFYLFLDEKRWFCRRDILPRHARPRSGRRGLKRSTTWIYSWIYRLTWFDVESGAEQPGGHYKGGFLYLTPPETSKHWVAVLVNSLWGGKILQRLRFVWRLMKTAISIDIRTIYF